MAKKTIIIIVAIVLVLCLICSGVGIFLYTNYISKGLNILDNTSKASDEYVDILDKFGDTYENISDGIKNTQDKIDNIETPEINTDLLNKKVDACGILTQTMAQAILNNAVIKSDSTTDTVCSYSTDYATSKEFALVTLVITPFTTSIEAKNAFTTAKSVSYKDKTVPVKVAGADEAYYAEGLVQLSILKGNKWLIVSVISDNYDSEQEGAIKAAEMMLPSVR